MALTQKTSLFWRILSSNIFLFLVLLILILTSWRLVRLTLSKQSLNQEVANLKGQVTQLQETKETITQDLERSSSKESLEKEARRRLNVKKPGESVVIVLPEGQKSQHYPLASQEKSEVSSKKASSWWQQNLGKWFQYFRLMTYDL